MQRKKEYIDYVRSLSRRGCNNAVRLASDLDRHRRHVLPARSSLNWIYQWYKVDGPLTEDQLAHELTELFTKGFLK